MGFIGDYIHASAHGYLNSGISREGNYVKWQSQHQWVKDRAKANATSKLTPKDKEELEETILSIMDSNTGSLSDKVKDAQQEVLKILQELLEKEVSGLDWDTGDVTWSTEERQKAIGKIHRSRAENNQLALNYEKALKKAQKLQGLIDKALSGFSDGELTKSEIDTVNEAAKQIQTLIDQLEAEVKRQAGEAVNAPELKSSEASLVRELNRLIQIYAAYPAINLQKGTAFEAIIAMAPYVAKGVALEEARKAITGAVPEDVTFDEEFFKGEGSFSDTLIGELGPGVFASVKGSTSYGKVDVNLTWNNKEARISAKNVNLEKNYARIHIVSGSSLLFLLQDVNADFVNHYLNIYATHHDSNKKGAGLAEHRQEIAKEIKLILFYKALTGDNVGRTSANVFVVNDNSVKNGGVRVYNMQDIITKVCKESDLLSKISIKTTNGKSITKVRFQNNKDEKDETGAVRIAKLLSDVHSKKIKVSFQAHSILKEL